jgi:hypothetical protein
MAARLTHASATPATLDLILRGMSETESCPGPMHRTAGGARLNYIVGVRIRAASLTFLLTTIADKQAFQSFYRTMKNANTRGTFVADATNYGTDTWSFFFTSEPSYERTQMPGARIYDTVSIDIEDQTVAL